MAVLQKWTDLPDPRNPKQGQTLTVVVTTSNWKHCSKHWLNHGEPWKEEFGAEVVTEIKPDLPSSAPWPSIVESVLGVLYRQTKDSLERPQAIVARTIPESDQQKAQKRDFIKWILVLPSGAVAILGGQGCRYSWTTCYFPREAAVQQSRRFRWQATVRCLIRRYVFVPCGSPAVALPKMDTEVVRRNTTGRVVERLWNMTFLTPETWGFCPELPGCPWRGRLPTWPAAGLAEEKRTKRRGLKPRFFRGRDDEMDY